MGFFTRNSEDKTDKRGIPIKETKHRSTIIQESSEPNSFVQEPDCNNIIKKFDVVTNIQKINIPANLSDEEKEKIILDTINSMSSSKTRTNSTKRRRYSYPATVIGTIISLMTVIVIVSSMVPVISDIKNFTPPTNTVVDNVVQTDNSNKENFVCRGNVTVNGGTTTLYGQDDVSEVRSFINSRYYGRVPTTPQKFETSSGLVHENYFIKELPLGNISDTNDKISLQIYESFLTREIPLKAYYPNYYDCTTLCYGPTVFQRLNLNQKGTDHITFFVTPDDITSDIRISYRFHAIDPQNINAHKIQSEICSLFGDLNDQSLFKDTIEQYKQIITTPQSATSSVHKTFTTLSGASVKVTLYTDADSTINSIVIQGEHTVPNNNYK
jgi:hypothetical protein